MHPAELSQWTARGTESLLRDGYCLLPRIASPEMVSVLDEMFRHMFLTAPFCHALFYGSQVKRLYPVFTQSKIVARFASHPLILGVLQRALTPLCERLRLNSIEALALYPGALPQLSHRDQDLWHGAIRQAEYLASVMWPFTTHAETSGAPSVYSCSHGHHALHPDEERIPLTVEIFPGDALLFLGSTLRGTGGNMSDQICRSMTISYCWEWLKSSGEPQLAALRAITSDALPWSASFAGSAHSGNIDDKQRRSPPSRLRPDARQLSRIWSAPLRTAQIASDKPFAVRPKA